MNNSDFYSIPSLIRTKHVNIFPHIKDHSFHTPGSVHLVLLTLAFYIGLETKSPNSMHVAFDFERNQHAFIICNGTCTHAQLHRQLNEEHDIKHIWHKINILTYIFAMRYMSENYVQEVF